MNLDFRDCKTKKDVEKVFEKNKKGFETIKKITEKFETLDDIECGSVDTAWMGGEPTECYPAVNRDGLREQMIKWIKYRISCCIFSCRNNHQRCKEHKFWMERFNITEKDLK